MRPMSSRWVLRVLVGLGVGASASGLPAAAPGGGAVAAPVRVAASSDTGARALQTLADLDPGTRAAVETAMRDARGEAGARDPVTIDPTWSQEAYLKASNTGGGDSFGYRVALSGDTLVVGAGSEDSSATGLNGDQSDNNTYNSGAVYVFTRTGAGWSQQAYLKASNTSAQAYFGSSVALSGDTLAVGASGEGTTRSGAAYVFTRTGATWSQQAYLKASNPETFDNFGLSVALSGDTLVVGAYQEGSSATGVNGDGTNNSASGSGAAYVFTRAGSTWSQQAYLKASNTGIEDQFGYSVAVSGNTLVVGAWAEDSSATGVNGDQANDSAGQSGAAYVFTRTGSTWSQQAYLKASNTGSGVTLVSDAFGASVAVSGDTLVVGAPFEASNATGVNGNQANNTAQSGATYVFTRTGTTWSQQAYLKASNTGAGDKFGESIALSGDTLMVGAPYEDSNATGVNGDQTNNTARANGAAYLFARTGATWSQQAYLKPSNFAGYFGVSVAVSGDVLVVGANAEASAEKGVDGGQSSQGAPGSGAAYAFSTGATPICTYSRSPTSVTGPPSGGPATISVTAPAGCSWTATSDAPSFVTVVSGATGTGSGTVGLQFPANTSCCMRIGSLTVAGRTVTTNQAAALPDVAVPFGTVDTPLNNSTGVNGSIAVTGWALDDVGVSAVRIMRDPVDTEPAGQKVFVGTAVLVTGARPDVAAQYGTYPNNTRAGWGYLLLTNMLPNRGNGVFTLYSYADDAAGRSTLLGSRTITCTNSTATTPFGAIDTPGQGETVSGSVNNFGWVLSPGARRADPPGGGTVTVFIDGAPVGAPAGWTSRSDISALFPVAQYSGVGSALAVLTFNTATLTNGVHTIAWGVTDSAGGSAGIGSRYFTVSNAGGLHVAPLSSAVHEAFGPVPVTARRGTDLDAPLVAVSRAPDGVFALAAEELERVELRVSANSGRLKSAIGDLPLPVGSSIDLITGTFMWQPGPGFIGVYELMFETPFGQQTIRVTLYPQGMLSRPQVIIDTPSTADELTGPFTIAGWAIDPRAREGTGVDAIHVWAYPVSDGAPVFIGATTLSGERPDVKAIYGERAARAGFGLASGVLSPGTYDLAVFAWSTEDRQFLPATTRRITVR